jgi:hypothetical protein
VVSKSSFHFRAAISTVVVGGGVAVSLMELTGKLCTHLF